MKLLFMIVLVTGLSISIQSSAETRIHTRTFPTGESFCQLKSSDRRGYIEAIIHSRNTWQPAFDFVLVWETPVISFFHRGYLRTAIKPLNESAMEALAGLDIKNDYACTFKGYFSGSEENHILNFNFFEIRDCVALAKGTVNEIATDGLCISAPNTSYEEAMANYP